MTFFIQQINRPKDFEKWTDAAQAVWRKHQMDLDKARRVKAAKKVGKVIKPRFGGNRTTATRKGTVKLKKNGLTGQADLSSLPTDLFTERNGGDPIVHTTKPWGTKKVFNLPYFEDTKTARYEMHDARLADNEGIVVFVLGPSNATLHVCAVFSTYVLAERLLGLRDKAISNSLQGEGALKGHIPGTITKAGGRYYVRVFQNTY